MGYPTLWAAAKVGAAIGAVALLCAGLIAAAWMAATFVRAFGGLL